VNLQNCVDDSIARPTRRRREHLLTLLLVLLVAACSATNYDDDEPRSAPRRPMADDGGTAQVQGMSGLMLPPADWWRQAEIADRVKPTADQVTALDKLQTDQGDEIEKLERDMSVAERDLRNVLESDKPASEAIVSAGQRIKTMRDDVFDRQLRLLAAERTILTREQWSSLQDAIRMSRRERNRNGMGGRGGGRGAYPGRGGRRPGGFPGW
jgi:hypothetical protein